MNKIESIVLNVNGIDKELLLNICDKNNIVSDVDANIIVNDSTDINDVIKAIKLPSEDIVDDNETYKYFYKSGNWNYICFDYNDLDNNINIVKESRKKYIALLVGNNVNLFDIYNNIGRMYDSSCEFLVMPAPDNKLNDNEIKVSVFYKD
ncbi:MAG: hypothetical protein IJK66_05070 [Bacilli bacterium]|nr:hypothetical protein [Bacilli bacterium]